MYLEKKREVVITEGLVIGCIFLLFSIGTWAFYFVGGRGGGMGACKRQFSLR